MAYRKARFIPAGAMKVSAKHSDAVAYVYASAKARPVALIYTGTGSKPYSWFTYRDQAAMERAIRAAFERRAAALAEKEADAAKRRAWANPYKAGDLFRRSWGYDQTNVDWYEVVAVRGKMMDVRKIATSATYTGWEQGKCVPLPGQYTGEVMRVRAQDGRIKINHYDHARFVAPRIVAGVPTYDADFFSTYA